MKYTEKQILEKAKKILQDLNGVDKEENIDGIFFNEKKQLIRGENKDKEHPCWTISIKMLFDNLDFLAISDETGEPLYYQNFNMIIAEIEKDSEGKYVIKK